MDPPQEYSTLLEAVSTVADPRRARGKQHEWRVLLTLICAAMASDQKSVRAMAQWVQEHACQLLQQLQPSCARLPSAATLYRAVRAIDVTELEEHLAIYARNFTRTLEVQPDTEHKHDKHEGLSIDGKQLRGARAHGRHTCLVSLVHHGSGVVLQQQAVDVKSNEITAVPSLLAGRDLSGAVVTVDALLTQRSISQQVLRQGGDYLMVAKQNQPELYRAIEQLFASPPWLAKEKALSYRIFCKTEKGHGRVEKRTLESSWVMCEGNGSLNLPKYLDWPGVKQVMRRTCRRVKLSTGEISEEVTYGITSLEWEEAGAEELERLWRGHWTIENRVHYVRDVTMREDQNQMWSGNAPQVLAAMRNGIVSLLRVSGWTSIAEALRHYSSAVSNALRLINSPLHSLLRL
jgi:predicted transposase YbfD/YdcC